MAAAEVEDDFILTEEDPLDDVARLNAEVTQVRQMFQELRTEVTLQCERASFQANRADQAVRELQEFKDRVVAVGQQAAEDHDMCGVYDEVMAELGLPGRMRNFDVSVRVSFEGTITVRATSLDDAEQAITERDLKGHWSPGSPYLDSEMAMQTYASNVEVEVL